MQAIRSLILTLGFMSFANARLSPVIIWGAHSVPKPSLAAVSSDEFVELVTRLLADKALVVFSENDLNSKDFLSTNIAGENSCYAYLQDAKDTTYYAAVENPLESLRAIKREHVYISVDAFGKLSRRVETNAGKINFLKFNDGNQLAERKASLQSHDAIIANITSQLYNENEVFFLYTSEPSASLLHRQRRQTPGGSEGYYFRHEADLLLYYKSLSISEGKAVKNLEINNLVVNSKTETTMSLNLQAVDGSQLTFDIILEGGYFLMKNLMYKDIKFRSSEVYAPTDFSYFCGNLTLTSESGPSNTLNWNLLQFQAPFGYTKNTSFAFGDAWHCVGFFTGAILSGLLTVALLLTITFIGVCWMMDINTMDRFDDPKGKTITISASD